MLNPKEILPDWWVAARAKIKRQLPAAKLRIMRWFYGPEIRLTCAGMTDGLGAQLHAVLSTRAVASYLGAHFVHTPLHSVYYLHGHEQEMDSAFGLGTGLDLVEECCRPVRKVKRLPLIPRRGVVYQIPHCHEYTNSLPDLLQRVAASARAGVRVALPEALPGVTVAVHVRRGDVSRADHSTRFTETTVIAETVEYILKTLRGVEISVVVISQGNESDFPELARLGCEFRLNTSVLDAFSLLMYADILVCAKSSMSYVCGLYSDGLVVYEPFWHPPQSTWLMLGDQKAIKAAISERFDIR